MVEINIPKPDDHLTIIYKGEPRELFMSYLRLNAHIRAIQSADRLINIMIDPDMVENTLQLALAPSLDAVDLMTMTLGETDLTSADVDKILFWTRDHLAHFFMKRFQEMADQGQQLGTVADRLKSSLTGLEPSTLSEASAGALT